MSFSLIHCSAATLSVYKINLIYFDKIDNLLVKTQYNFSYKNMPINFWWIIGGVFR